MTSKAVFTTFEAARLCHVSPLSIINWVNAGRLAAFRTPGGHRRIRREDLVLFMQESGIPLPEDLKSGSSRRRVLLVEADSHGREALASHLQSRARPFEVSAAATPFEAGRMLATFRPDVVVIDLRMPGLDAPQACHAIKADPKSASTLVIATAQSSPEVEARLLECGVLRCFPRPVDPAALSRFIEAALDEQSRPRSRRSRPARG